MRLERERGCFWKGRLRGSRLGGLGELGRER